MSFCSCSQLDTLIAILKGNTALETVLVLFPTGTKKVRIASWFWGWKDIYLVFEAPEITITLLGKYLNILSK